MTSTPTKAPIQNLFASFSRKTADYVEKAKLTEHTFMIIIALIIGVLGGFSAIGIRALIEGISDLSFSGGGTFLQNVIAAPWYLKLLAPVIGALLFGPMIYFWAPEAKGHGVPEVMQAILQKGGKIRPRVAIIKALASAITIGTGGSVGREGPIVQIGSSIGSSIGQFFRVRPNRMKTLVGCGAAAGIAAAFNAPIAGALFAVEIILMDFAVAQFSPIVISSVMATVVSRQFEGDFAAFNVPTYYLVGPQELIFYFILGALAGLVSYLFIKLLYYFEDLFDNKLNFPEYLKPIFGGIGIGLIAIAYPEVMGVGYDSINLALHGNLIWYFALILIFVKVIGTALTLGSGGSGGIFAPSLFMGAALGAAFGGLVHSLFPAFTATPGAYALVAMGGLVAGTTRAPITAIIIVFELTNDYHIILPLMITCIISTILSSKLSRESIYTLKLLLRGINLKEGTQLNVMNSIFVKGIYNKQFSRINVTDNFSKIVNMVITKPDSEFPVVNSKDDVLGIISINSIKDYLFDKDSLKNVLIAADIANTNIEPLTEDDTCQTALDRMSRLKVECLPVIASEKSRKIIGMLSSTDIQSAYQKEIDRREISENLASSIVMKENETNIHFIEGYSINEIHAPNSFVGKSIRNLNIRARYGVDVLSIKQKINHDEKITPIPSPDYCINEKDVLIVAGEIKNINLLKNLQ